MDCQILTQVKFSHSSTPRNTTPSSRLRLLTLITLLPQSVISSSTVNITSVTPNGNMCTASTIHFWCPCTSCAADHPGNPDGRFHGEVQGHKVVQSIHTGTYHWCDEYFLSPSFDAFAQGVPCCPTQHIEEAHFHFSSTGLCDDCIRNGCVLQREKRGMYGRRTVGEKARLAVRSAAKRERTATKTKEQWELNAKAQREITSQGNDTVTSLPGNPKVGLQRAENNDDQGFLQSADWEWDSFSRHWDKLAARMQRPASSECNVLTDATIDIKHAMETKRSFDNCDPMENDQSHSQHVISDSDLPARPMSRVSVVSRASTSNR